MSKSTNVPSPVKKINWKGHIQKVNVQLSESAKKKDVHVTKEKNNEKPDRIKRELE